MVARRSANSGKARRRIATDERGVSAIEFALIAPALIVMFMALCDLCSAVMTQLHVDRASEGTGDVVATYPTMRASDMAIMFTAASQFMQPYSSTPLSVRISNIYAAQNGNAQVYWSCVSQNSTIPILAANSVVTSTLTGTPIPFLLTTGTTNSTSFNSSVIMVDISYVFSPPTSRIIIGPHTMTSTAYLQPRKGLYVGFPWGGGSTLPPAPNNTTTSSSTTLTNGATCNYMQ